MALSSQYCLMPWLERLLGVELEGTMVDEGASPESAPLSKNTQKIPSRVSVAREGDHTVRIPHHSAPVRTCSIVQ
jgi:hypothetical protein